MPTILVYWSEGRSREQKARVIDGIVQVMVAQGGARPEDVVVILQDVDKGDIGRGTPASDDQSEASA
jgi:4-oxalocrotonate tautomerase family enzyme